MLIRLQKFFTDCGVMSRRAAEAEIEKGTVTVNGVTATTGQKVDPKKDKILWNNEPVVYDPKKKPVCVLLNKPRGYVTTLSDERGRKTVSELVADVGTRLYPVGRLDLESEGLLLMTNDGALTNRLTHPKEGIPKIYHVVVAGNLTEGQLRHLSSPMVIDGYKILPVPVVVLERRKSKTGKDCTVLEMTLLEGRNRQIRKMCAETHLSVLRLKRVAIGLITLHGVKPGTWRYLSNEEIAYLKGELEVEV
jgi:23S rRNA pseudouridine2605 synthase